jgi:light-regulated signal transduction histidine kinase (bacteriophytochrome)
MVFPIIVDGVLWGLFVCHNAEEKYINYDSRVVVEQMAMMFMSKLIELEPSAHRISDRRATARRMLDELSIGRSIIGALGGAGASRHSRLHARTVAMIARQLGCLTPVAADVDTGSAAESGAPSAFENDLLSLVDADGAAVVRGNTVFRFGQAPDEITVRGIAGLIATRMATPDGAGCGFYATNDVGDLAQVGDETRAHAAGVLAVAPNGAGSDLILWFRKEQRIDATWAGRPPEAEELNTPAMLRPRSSAGRVQKVLAGVARPWTETEGRVAAEFADEVAHGWQSAGAAAEGAVAARAAYGYGEGDRDGASTATSAA